MRSARSHGLPPRTLALHARDYTRSRRAARPRTALSSSPVTMPAKKRQQYIIGVDLGGTNIIAGALSVDGTKHFAVQTVATDAQSGAEGVSDRIIGVIEAVMRDTIAATG